MRRFHTISTHSAVVHCGLKLHKIELVEYWAIRSSARSFTCTAHSFVSAALLALLARSTALISVICSLARSLAEEKEKETSYPKASYLVTLDLYGGRAADPIGDNVL